MRIPAFYRVKLTCGLYLLTIVCLILFSLCMFCAPNTDNRTIVVQLKQNYTLNMDSVSDLFVFWYVHL